jgi:hypothetical protein
MNVATHYHNLKVAQTWALMAFLEEARKAQVGIPPNQYTQQYWALDEICGTYEKRLAFLEDMHGAHTMAPTYPTAAADDVVQSRLVNQARAAWAERIINRLTEQAMFDIEWEAQGKDPGRFLWACERGDTASVYKRRAQKRHEDLCDQVFHK